MKMVIRKLSVLSLVLCLPISVSAFYIGGLDNFQKTATYVEGQFADVDKAAWYYENIASVYEYSLMNGKGETTFDPMGRLLLAEVVTVATRIHCNYFSGYIPQFQVDDGDLWYMPYVGYALENELQKESSFDYTVPATRAQFAQILATSVDSADLEAINIVDDGAIPDVPMTADYADSVYLLYRAGVLSGSDELGTFMPDSTITRAEAAAIITRIIDPTLRKTIELAGEY